MSQLKAEPIMCFLSRSVLIFSVIPMLPPVHFIHGYSDLFNITFIDSLTAVKLGRSSVADVYLYSNTFGSSIGKRLGILFNESVCLAKHKALV